MYVYMSSRVTPLVRSEEVAFVLPGSGMAAAKQFSMLTEQHFPQRNGVVSTPTMLLSHVCVTAFQRLLPPWHCFWAAAVTLLLRLAVGARKESI